MGGFGSGRRPERTRYAVEDMRSIPMSWIKVNKAALLKAPRAINWKVGDSSYGSALIGLEGNSVRVTFQVREAKDRPWQHLAVSVETIEQPCHLGGVRRWFVCPRCGQRVGTLYIGSDVGCRHCMRLTYWSAQADKMERLRLKKKKILSRMEGGHLAAPQRMQQKTYLRHLQQYQKVEEQINELFLLEIQKILQTRVPLGKNGWL